jgi:carboxyl-terminal processing protease
VIYLPKFYIDFENKDGRDAGKDIALEVERLKSANVDGVLDVRDDGGSLSTVDIAGLYRARSYRYKLNQQEEKKRFCMIEIKKLSGMGR